MCPSSTCAAPRAAPPGMTVAGRKEALERRKAMKPLMEKRRRARINDSLKLLETLILPLTGRDKNRYSKLEKADVLDMTVRFLSNIPPVTSTRSADSYREGYRACVRRVSALLPNMHVDPDACRRVNHFLQRSASAAVSPSCLRCCARGSRTVPQIQQSLKSRFSCSQSRTRTSSCASDPCGEQPGVQLASATVWRPW